MTMHISPTSNDPAAYLARTGVRPIVHFDRLGILGPHLLLAHAVWLDDEEVELVRTHRHRGRVVPVGLPPPRPGHGQRWRSHMAMHRAGVAVGLGCDAPNANDGVDILDAARLAVGHRQGRGDRPDDAPAPTTGWRWRRSAGPRRPAWPTASARSRSARPPTSSSTTAARRSGGHAATRCSS